VSGTCAAHAGFEGARLSRCSSCALGELPSSSEAGRGHSRERVRRVAGGAEGQGCFTGMGGTVVCIAGHPMAMHVPGSAPAHGVREVVCDALGGDGV
jgi:hypothetical protein